MGARTTVYCLVEKHYQEWVTVSAVTLDEAKEEARALPDVDRVLLVQYDDPDEGEADNGSAPRGLRYE